MSQDKPQKKGLSDLARFGYGLAVIVLILDQVSKYIILNVADLDSGGAGNRIEVMDPWFNLTMVWNRGVSFGLFEAESLVQRLILVGLSLAISLALIIWTARAERRLQVIAFGMIIGGAIGNVIDRLVYGAVADFLDFSGLYFPYVFNVADAGISVGVAILLLDMFLNDRKEHAADA